MVAISIKEDFSVNEILTMALTDVVSPSPSKKRSRVLPFLKILLGYRIIKNKPDGIEVTKIVDLYDRTFGPYLSQRLLSLKCGKKKQKVSGSSSVSSAPAPTNISEECEGASATTGSVPNSDHFLSARDSENDSGDRESGEACAATEGISAEEATDSEDSLVHTVEDEETRSEAVTEEHSQPVGSNEASVDSTNENETPTEMFEESERHRAESVAVEQTESENSPVSTATKRGRRKKTVSSKRRATSYTSANNRRSRTRGQRSNCLVTSTTAESIRGRGRRPSTLPELRISHDTANLRSDYDSIYVKFENLRSYLCDCKHTSKRQFRNVEESLGCLVEDCENLYRRLKDEEVDRSEICIPALLSRLYHKTWEFWANRNCDVDNRAWCQANELLNRIIDYISEYELLAALRVDITGIQFAMAKWSYENNCKDSRLDAYSFDQLTSMQQNIAWRMRRRANLSPTTI